MFSYHEKMQTFVWGHRGAPRLAIENTLESFRLAIDYQLDGFEFDVQFSRDGQAFIFHDDSLARLAGMNQRAADQSWHDLQQLELKDPQLQDAELGRIPLLEEVLMLVPDNIFINLELKGETGIDSTRIDNVLSLLKRCSLTDRSLVSSFNHSYLRLVRDRDPNISIAEIWDRPVDSYRIVQQGLTNIIHLPWNNQTQDQIVVLHDNGYEVGMWGAKGKDEVQKCLASGVDAIFVDDPRWLN